MIRRPLRLFAVCLALVGQVVGAFGLPAARGAHGTPDAACGCCPAVRTAGRCCCHHGSEPAADDGIAPCCRAKKAPSGGLNWVIPTLRSQCQGPADVVPESVVPASVPPGPPAHWSDWPTDLGPLPATDFAVRTRLTRPDVPPPRVS